MINSGLYDRMNIAGEVNLSLDKSRDYYLFMNLDILNGCEFSCHGCYVNKGVNSTDLSAELKMVADIADEVNRSSFHLEEIAIGPTDFFSAKNTVDVIGHPDFKRLFKNPDTKFVMLSTMKSSAEVIKTKLDILEQNVGRLDIDLLIATDIDEFINDPDYISNIKRKWDVLVNSGHEFDPAFQINIHPSKLIEADPENVSKLAAVIKEEFDTILEFNPSILRIKHREQKDKLEFWMRTVRDNFHNNKTGFTYTMLNKSHNGMNNLVVNFKNGGFYICPFIYENVFAYENAYLIPKKAETYKLDDLTGAKENFVIKQMEYSMKTSHCQDCEFLVSCSYKNVLTFMETNKISDCFLGLGNGEIHGRSI